MYVSKVCFPLEAGRYRKSEKKCKRFLFQSFVKTDMGLWIGTSHPAQYLPPVQLDVLNLPHLSPMLPMFLYIVLVLLWDSSLFQFSILLLGEPLWNVTPSDTSKVSIFGASCATCCSTHHNHDTHLFFQLLKGVLLHVATLHLCQVMLPRHNRSLTSCHFMILTTAATPLLALLCPKPLR